MSAGKQGPPGLRWHCISARRFHFPGFGSRTAREGNDNHGEAEAQAPGDSEDAGWAPRPPGPESELEPWPSLSRGRRFLAWTRSGPLAAPSPAFRAGYFTEVAPQLGLLAPGH